MENQLIKISKLKANNGQFPGLPKNPRKISSTAKEQLRKSITDTPELLEYKALLVYPFEGNYIVIAGNSRLSVCKELKYKELPCFVIPTGTPIAKLKEYAIKDNINSGTWSWSDLKSDWPEINDWGLFEIEPTKDATTSVSFEATNPKPIILTVEFESTAAQEVLFEKLQKEGYSCWLGKRKPKQ